MAVVKTSPSVSIVLAVLRLLFSTSSGQLSAGVSQESQLSGSYRLGRVIELNKRP